MASVSSLTHLPGALWLTVKSYIPSLWETPKDKHSRLWNSIFPNKAWLWSMVDKGLYPVLIGCDLDKTKPKYLVLVLGHNGDGGKYHKPDPSNQADLLQKCFHPTAQNIAPGEWFFPKTELTLNVKDARSSDYHYTDVSKPGRLVSHKGGSQYSAYQYWNDNSFAVRHIQSKDIIGIKKNLREDDVSDILGLTWEHLPNKTLRQHFFQKAGMETRTNQFDNNKRGSSYKVIGWKWKNLRV
ncbi:hypothetical protein BDZ45DRAFT_749025 [Acephala macrosclerotiorum]|nr:hypothetical protein BDZ45DRAFT_749025 [Acephala macrosclerotiorum]